MVVTEALELGILIRGMVVVLKSALMSLQWFIFEGWLQQNRDGVLSARYLGPVATEARSRPLSGQGESTGLNETALAFDDGDD